MMRKDIVRKYFIERIIGYRRNKYGSIPIPNGNKS